MDYSSKACDEAILDRIEMNNGGLDSPVDAGLITLHDFSTTWDSCSLGVVQRLSILLTEY
jgi:hypothetical protein